MQFFVVILDPVDAVEGFFTLYIGRGFKVDQRNRRKYCNLNTLGGGFCNLLANRAIHVLCIG